MKKVEKECLYAVFLHVKSFLIRSILLFVLVISMVTCCLETAPQLEGSRWFTVAPFSHPQSLTRHTHSVLQSSVTHNSTSYHLLSRSFHVFEYNTLIFAPNHTSRTILLCFQHEVASFHEWCAHFCTNHASRKLHFLFASRITRSFYFSDVCRPNLANHACLILTLKMPRELNSAWNNFRVRSQSPLGRSFFN